VSLVIGLAAGTLTPHCALAMQEAAPPPPTAVGGERPERQKPAEAGLPDRPVSIQEALQIAYQNHARLAVAEESVAAARQRVRQARTGTLPTVTGSVGYNGQGTSNLGGIFGGNPRRNVALPGGGTQSVSIDRDTATFNQGLQPRLSLNYNVYDGGLTRVSVRQARANVEGSIANLATVRNNQTFEVTTNYLVQLRSRRLLELRVAQEKLAEEQLRAVDASIEVGEAAVADRALVLSEYQNRRVDRIQVENDLRVAANSLRNSMGLPVGPPLELVELQENLEPLLPLETLRATAQRQRPEVIQAETQVRVAQASVSIARIGRKPRLDTTFQFNVSPNDPFTRGDYAVGAAVSLPIWDAGLSHSQEQEAKTGVSSSAAQLEQTKKDVSADVEEAYLNLVNARERLAAGRLAVEAAQVNVEVTTARYQRGLAGTDVLDLITAQVQFATANNNAISALYDIYLAQAQLNRAIGR
jgi:outer membrane protein